MSKKWIKKPNNYIPNNMCEESGCVNLGVISDDGVCNNCGRVYNEDNAREAVMYDFNSFDKRMKQLTSDEIKDYMSYDKSVSTGPGIVEQIKNHKPLDGKALEDRVMSFFDCNRFVAKNFLKVMEEFKNRIKSETKKTEAWSTPVVSCGFEEPWQKPCTNKKPCSEHDNIMCGVCKTEKATKRCDFPGQLICGGPLCDNCKHEH